MRPIITARSVAIVTGAVLIIWGFESRDLPGALLIVLGAVVLTLSGTDHN